MMTIKVRHYRGEYATYRGRNVDTIVRRVFGRRASVMGTTVIGPKVSGGYPVLGELVSVDGEVVGR